jgi:hypothetical protein
VWIARAPAMHCQSHRNCQPKAASDRCHGRQHGGGMKSWHGGHSPKIPPALEEDRRLELADGRIGSLHINRVNMGSHQATIVEFQGSGPLA